jgi:hypothetical protein
MRRIRTLLTLVLFLLGSGIGGGNALARGFGGGGFQGGGFHGGGSFHGSGGSHSGWGSHSSGGFHGGGGYRHGGGYYGGGGHGHVGVFIGAPFFWGPDFYYPYAYPYPYPYPYPYYYYPDDYVSSSPPVYVEQGDEEASPLQPGYWYYCANPPGYYPQVQQCPGGWQPVAPQPPPPPPS